MFVAVNCANISSRLCFWSLLTRASNMKNIRLCYIWLELGRQSIDNTSVQLWKHYFNHFPNFTSFQIHMPSKRMNNPIFNKVGIFHSQINHTSINVSISFYFHWWFKMLRILSDICICLKFQCSVKAQQSTFWRLLVVMHHRCTQSVFKWSV